MNQISRKPNDFSGWGFLGYTYEKKGEIVVSCSGLNHNDEEFEEDLGKLVAAEKARVAAEVAASKEMVLGAGH